MKAARGIAVAAALVATLGLGACGGDDGEDGLALPAGHGSVQVIEGWVETLSSGDVEGAADYFALPSVAENAAAPLALRTHADVVAFNRSLPCGAKLLRARPAGRLIDATFRLTERPGGDCGSGTGLLARTAFLVRDGKIKLWRRLPNPPRRGPDGGGGGGPIV
ncbi:MAG: nuclear transport factor 2 family protein [Actinomycetota bacterium]